MGSILRTQGFLSTSSGDGSVLGDLVLGGESLNMATQCCECGTMKMGVGVYFLSFGRERGGAMAAASEDILDL